MKMADRSTSRKGSRRPGSSLDKESNEYKARRERNNLAVKKSRSKSKVKTQETVERVNSLREENAKLENKIQLLTKELGFLKDLFIAHAGNSHGQDIREVDLTTVLNSEGEESVMDVSSSLSVKSEEDQT